MRALTILPRSEVAFETPLAQLVPRLTPNAAFFVRNHAREVPRIEPASFALEIAGAGRTRTLRLDELRALPRAAETITLMCAGNGRSAFEPAVDGVPWDFGAIATARWDGVRLRDVLALAGGGAAHAVFDGYDASPDGVKPPYRRSIPLARALLDGTIVADTMNGEPLPAEHGGPLRLVVAGWTANHSMKWLRRIALADQPDESTWMTDDYRVPGPTGTMDVLEAAAPLAILATPASGEQCARDITLRGIAYGEPAPQHVRVEVDGAPAGDAAVRYEDGPYACGRWTLDVRLEPGRRRITVRPVGAQGEAGPRRATWNARGYRYDGPHAVDVTVA